MLFRQLLFIDSGLIPIINNRVSPVAIVPDDSHSLLARVFGPFLFVDNFLNDL